MAQAAKPPSVGPETATAPAKSSGKLLLIILLVAVFILILAVVGFGALLLMKKGSGANASADPPPVSAPPAAPAPATFSSAIDLNKPPVFVQLDAFTINLRAEEGGDSHYLQTEISLRVHDQKTGDAIKGWMPEIRNRINLILTSKSISDMQHDTSHEKVQDEIMRELNTLFGVPSPPPGQAPLGPIQGVLFISFIVQ
jgi:flagellar FliL protein